MLLKKRTLLTAPRAGLRLSNSRIINSGGLDQRGSNHLQINGQLPNSHQHRQHNLKRDQQAKLQVLHSVAETSEPTFLIDYSDFHKLLRFTAWTTRFMYKARKCESNHHEKHLSQQEIYEALQYWIKKAQALAFHREIYASNNNQQLPKHSLLNSLSPFIDGEGLLRVGGRLQNAPLPYDSKHPFIMPQHSHLSILIIKEYHLRTLHGGTTITLSLMRQRFWIICGRSSVRFHMLNCPTCFKFRAERMTQLMGHLPPHRVAVARIFQHTGVDYAGPFTLKERRGRSRTQYKAYVAFFICAAISLIHLELVTDYTSEAFIAAFKRFTSIYGTCQILYSDQGTNFVGADRELTRLFAAASAEQQKLSHLLAKDGTQWFFNPPAAPHFGAARKLASNR